MKILHPTVLNHLKIITGHIITMQYCDRLEQTSMLLPENMLVTAAKNVDTSEVAVPERIIMMYVS